MEYVNYILITLGVMVLCVMVFWRKDLFARSHAPTEEASREVEISSDDRLNVPTPWGWPGNDSAMKLAEERTVSESLHRFVDHLISEKQTVEDQEYVLRKRENLRLLIEDRYGSSRTGKQANGDARKGKPETGGSSIIADLSRGSLHDVRKPWGW
jgi:hypothetical protein